MWGNRQTVTITTNGSGTGTGYTDVVNGRILHIRYVKTDYANGSTFTVTGDTTGASIWTESSVNASAERLPKQATHSTAGAAALYAAAGTAVLDYIPIANERIKIVVTNGGDTKVGTFYITVG